MKLCAHDSKGNLPTFVYNYLQDRTFSIKLPNNVISAVFVKENRVLQGSVLSPILFCIMIKGIPSINPILGNLKNSLYAQFMVGWIQDNLDFVHH